jgi:hypothetical protein
MCKETDLGAVPVLNGQELHHIPTPGEVAIGFSFRNSDSVTKVRRALMAKLTLNLRGFDVPPDFFRVDGVDTLAVLKAELLGADWVIFAHLGPNVISPHYLIRPSEH